MKIKIYTDGACSGNPGNGGWASVVTVYERDKTCVLDRLTGGEKNTTNNRMELVAVIQSLSHILKCTMDERLSKGDDTFEIYSDSAYVINAIKNRWIEKWMGNGWKTKSKTDVKNRELWENFIYVRSCLKEKNIKVKFIKVKGHNGVEFNEMADKLARREVLNMEVE